MVSELNQEGSFLPEFNEHSLYRGESIVGQQAETESKDGLDPDQIVEVVYKWGGKGYLQVELRGLALNSEVKELKKTINIQVKTVFGDRKTFQVKAPIEETLAYVLKQIEAQGGSDFKTLRD